LVVPKGQRKPDHAIASRVPVAIRRSRIDELRAVLSGHFVASGWDTVVLIGC
jgi:hypothetical protein